MKSSDNNRTKCSHAVVTVRHKGGVICKLAAGCVCGGACVREVNGADKEEEGTMLFEIFILTMARGQ